MSHSCESAMTGAVWAGDAKWEVTPSGCLSPCSLKKLTLCYISEHLGFVCNVSSQDYKSVSFREPRGRLNLNDGQHKQAEASSSCVGKSACGNSDLTVFTRASNESSSNDTSVVSLNGCAFSVNDNTFFGDSKSGHDNTQNLIPYSVLNVPNYGKVYDKSNSTDPPGDDRERKKIFKNNFYNFEFRNPDVYLSPHTAAMLLEELDRCGMLNDSVLSLFNNKRMLLYEVSIRRCGKSLSLRGLHCLLLSNLRRVQLHHLDIPPDNFTMFFNPWTKENLAVLSLRGYAPAVRGAEANNGLYCLIKELPNLQDLDLSNVNFLNANNLQEILLLLPKLWKLNISHCTGVTTIEPLRVVSHQILHLSLAGVMIQSTSITISVLKTLTKLKYLDVSTIMTSAIAGHEECINEVLVDPEFAPDLEYLDVSNQIEVSREVLTNFLKTHTSIRCVGIINVAQCADFDTTKWLHVKFLREVGPESDAVSRLNECLAHYRLWPHVINKLLMQTNSVTASTAVPQPHLIANILRCLESHQGRAHVQVSGSACLYNLTAGNLASTLHPTLLRSVVHTTIHAMTRHKTSHQLQKNGLLMLCCDSVLHHVSFNQYWVAKMALHALHSYNDDSVDLMAVGICSILAAKLTNEQTVQLGCPPFMKKLLALVRGRVYDENADITLQFTLSALWNLTDESPQTCKEFLLYDGLQLFIQLLLKFPENTAVETKVLGLFNNVAEVPVLRTELLQPAFIAMLRRQLKSEQIAVSYFAAGISANLVCTDQQTWQACTDLLCKELLHELGQAVLSWKAPKEEMVAYKSFQPFLPLLRSSNTPNVQLWALWALHHVTVNNSKYYCPMLIREGIPELLEKMHNKDGTLHHVSELAGKLLQLIHEYRSIADKLTGEYGIFQSRRERKNDSKNNGGDEGQQE